MVNERSNLVRIIVLICLCIFNLLYMHNYIIFTCQVEDVVEWTSWVDNVCRVCFDVWAVFTICLFVTRCRINICILFSFYITILWAVVNILYSRFFYHYVSLSSIGETGAIIDPLVYKSVIAGLNVADLYFPFIIIVFHVIYRRHFYFENNMKYYFKRSIVLFALLFLLNLVSHMIFCSLDPSLRYLSYFERRVGMRLFGQNHLLALPIYANFHNGSIKSLAIEVYFEFQGNYKLSEEQRNLIDGELRKPRESFTNKEDVKARNVIFILVESYMSFVTDMMVDGREVTPYLNALKQDTSVYYNGHVHSNITMGESSDGQYILMTGILPLRSMITVSKAHRKPLPSLVKSLQAKGINESRMILPTSSSLWRQDDMCKQYGFKHLFASNDYPGKHEQTLTDKQVFELTEQKDSVLSKEPFFSMILTATMHQPYNKIVDHSFVITDKSLTSEMKSYLNVCHYTDNCIGMYLKSLKSLGLYDNSLIVITADHPAHNADFGDNVSSEIPLFIINGKIENDAYHEACNQIDIYTTIIDVLGLKNVWPGLGYSLLNSSYENSVTPLKWEVSELLLMSDFFLNKNY